MTGKRPDVEIIFDKYAKDYAAGGGPPSKFNNSRVGFSYANEVTWHFIVKYLPRDKSALILDAGAGTGYWARKLAKLGYKNIVLMDISQKMLEEAEKTFSDVELKFNVHFVKSDIINMKEFESDTFDYVFSQFDAISCCMNPKLAISEIARVVKTKSYVVVSLDTKFRRVPEYIELGFIEEAKTLLKTNVSNEFGFPQYNFSWEELATYFTDAGLDVVEVVGAPVFMHQIDENKLKLLDNDPKIRKELLQIEMEHCTNKSLVNFAGHLQMIGKKSSL